MVLIICWGGGGGVFFGMNTALEGTYFVGNSVFSASMSYCCIIQYQINTDRLLKSRLEKSPRLFPLNIVYLFCEVRYGWSPLMRRNIVSASQAPFSLSNSALWRFFNGRMLKGEKIKAFLLRQGRNSRYSTSARA